MRKIGSVNGGWQLLVLPITLFLLVTNAYANDDDILDMILPAILAAAKKVPASSTALVGSWLFDGTNKTVITFVDETNYFVTQDIDDIGEPLCSDGMESGTYTWDAVGGDFNLINVIDTTGDCGLTSVQGAPFSATVTVNGSTLTLTDSEGSFQLTKVIDANNSIVGSWYFSEPGGGETLVTFLDGINYFVAQDVDDIDEPLCSDGMESGTYTWDSASGNFNYTNIIDTTGDCGMTSKQGETGDATVTVSGSTLIFTDSEGPVSLTSVQ